MPIPHRVHGHPVLIRFWVEFDWGDQAPKRAERLGCGVTAFDREDALRLIAEVAFANEDMPLIRSVTENIDIRTLDPGHVLPSMGAPSERGVWFPNYPR